jgi:hypothetical protein
MKVAVCIEDEQDGFYSIRWFKDLAFAGLLCDEDPRFEYINRGNPEYVEVFDDWVPREGYSEPSDYKESKIKVALCVVDHGDGSAGVRWYRDINLAKQLCDNDESYCGNECGPEIYEMPIGWEPKGGYSDEWH